MKPEILNLDFLVHTHPVEYMTFVCLPKKSTESSGGPSNWHQLKL